MAIGRPISLTGNVASKFIRVLATEGQTVFTVTGGYRINQIGVFRNGVRLSNSSDFSAQDGATVTLVAAASLNDEVLFEIQDDFRVADAIVSAASSQTINGNLAITGNLYYDNFAASGILTTGGSASGLTNVVNSIVAGDNISISGATGDVTITGLASTDVIVSERILVSGVTTSTGGFVGNLTGNVVGNVTGNTSGTAGGLTGTPNIVVGSVTGTTGSFSGDVSIGGTLTYEDVTNVDSVGLVTARSGVIVSGSGIGLSVTEGGARVTGIVTATSYRGDTSDVVSGKWTLGADGTNNYTFTGPGLIGAENDPTIYVQRGMIYEFVNGMGAHPFRIQSTANGSTGTQYNDGITNNDVSNGTLTWKVQMDAPDTLYYQCTAHGNMGGEIKVGGGGGGGSTAGTVAISLFLS